MKHRQELTIYDKMTYTKVPSPAYNPGSYPWVDWLLDHESSGHFCFGGNHVFFSDDKDAALFILRWQ